MERDGSSTRSDAAFSTAFKIIMVGEAGVGKTCIVNRLKKNVFTNTEANVGANFCSKIMTVSASCFHKPEQAKL